MIILLYLKVKGMMKMMRKAQSDKGGMKCGDDDECSSDDLGYAEFSDKVSCYR